MLALSKRWAEPECEYRRWHACDGLPSLPFALGQVQMVYGVAPGISVANLIGQEGIRPDRRGRPPVRYQAIRAGLERVAQYAVESGASIHMPRIGSGLAGGSWPEIARIIDETLIGRDLAVTVYDLSPSGLRRKTPPVLGPEDAL